MRLPSNRFSLALLLIVSVPVLLISRKYVHFQPSSWWLASAFTPALLLSILVPVTWLIRGLGEPDGPISSPSGLPENAFVFRILPAIAAFGLIFVTAYITIPAVLALALGGHTTHQVMAATNIVGSPDRPSRGCRYKAVIADSPSSIFGRVCYDSLADKKLAMSMGARVTVELHGWGNRFGIYYTSTDPVGPAKL